MRFPAIWRFGNARFLLVSPTLKAYNVVSFNFWYVWVGEYSSYWRPTNGTRHVPVSGVVEWEFLQFEAFEMPNF